MEIVPIFVPESGDYSQCCLWSVHFPGEEFDEFRRLFNEWNDPERLRDFFKANEQPLKTEFWNKNISTAVFDVIEEAAGFEADLQYLEGRILQGESGKIINKIFAPFHTYETAPVTLKGKAIGTRRPYLRLYGLHLADEGQVVIFGGGIKLTRTVQESVHLMPEINKANRVKTFLKENGIQFLD